MWVHVLSLSMLGALWTADRMCRGGGGGGGGGGGWVGGGGGGSDCDGVLGRIVIVERIVIVQRIEIVERIVIVQIIEIVERIVLVIVGEDSDSVGEWGGRGIGGRERSLLHLRQHGSS